MVSDKEFSELIEHLILETIEESALRGFNLDQFQKLGTVQDKLVYAKKFLPFIGEGSARKVFAISTSKVLKIAKNTRGVAQNQTEYKFFKNPKTGPIVAKIFSADIPTMTWVISEIAKPFRYIKELEAVTGVDYYVLQNLLDDFPVRDFPNAEAWFEETQEFWTQMLQSPGLTPQSKEKMTSRIKQYEAYKNNKFLTGVLNLVKQGLIAGDLTFDQMGITADGRPIVIDYGFDREVEELYY